jgi:NAD-dependent deacetylase
MDDATRAVADVCRGSDVVVLTGAGVSTASGVPDFRGGEDGPGPSEAVWDRFDPMDFHRRRFDADPAGFWADRVELRERLVGDGIEPNAAHQALAAMTTRGDVDTLVTQNVDGLHQAAGAEDVLELHGSHARAVCDDCGRRVGADGVFDRVRDGERPPLCAACAGVLKPDVVLFGEELPGETLERAQRRARACDVFLAVGSSLTVRPASLLPRIAAESGATLVVVNLESTPVDDSAAHVLRADVTDVVPAIAEHLRGDGA